MRTCRNFSVFATYRPDVLPETTEDPAEWNQASARRLGLLCDRRLIFGRRNVPTLLSRLFPSTYEYTGWGGIRTRGTLRYTRFPGVPDRPLWHPSKKQGGDSEAETPEFQLKLAEGGGSAFRVYGLGFAAAASLRLNGFVRPRKMDFVDDTDCVDFVDGIKSRVQKRNRLAFCNRTPQLSERRTPNAERRTPNAERRTPNAERRTPNAERYPLPSPIASSSAFNSAWRSWMTSSLS
jgi:hypothetical protein